MERANPVKSANERKANLKRRTAKLAAPGRAAKKAKSNPFKKTEQHQEKRDAIVAVAAKLIHDHGVAGTSLDQVADALGVTKPSVYYYVRNKEDLVALCHLRIANQQAQAIDHALASKGSGLKKIEAFIRAYAQFVWSPGSGLPRLWQDNSMGATKRREVNRAYFAQSDRLVQLIKDAQDDKSIRAPNAEVVERALVSSILWVPIWYNEKAAPYDHDELLTLLLELFLKGLEPR
jgi:AcrR family transcriptional regulator